MKLKWFFLAFIAVLFLLPLFLFAQAGDTGLDFPVWFYTGMGLLFPILNTLGTKYLKTSKAKFFGCLGMAAVWGVIGALIVGISLNDLPLFLTAAFILSEVSYHAWWKTAFKKLSQ